MPDPIEIASAFITGAPPGELQDVVNDIRSLSAGKDPSLMSKLQPAFQQYSEDQLVISKLPGSDQSLVISKYNRLPDGRYYDLESKRSFEFDHISQKASSPQPFDPFSASSSTSATSLIPSLQKSLSTYTAEHYPSGTHGIYPINTPSANSLAILLVSNRYSPNNFWNGRWRSSYVVDTSTSTSSSENKVTSITGSIQVTVHYYEDGNVNLSTTKPIRLSAPDIFHPPPPPPPTSSSSSSITISEQDPETMAASTSASAIMRSIAQAEREYQTELNRAFGAMNEDGFKALRRQLPVTRQKVEWEKVGGYRLGGDLKGAAGR